MPSLSSVHADKVLSPCTCNQLTFHHRSRRNTSAPVGNRLSAPVPTTSTPPPEAFRCAFRCSLPPPTSSDKRSAADGSERDREAEGREGRREEVRNSVRIGRPARQSVVERRQGVQGVLRVQQQSWPKRHKRRMRACVREKKSQVGSVASERTIKKSRRERATRCRPGRCAPSERRVKNYDARPRMARQASRAFESNTTRDAVKLSLMHF